MTFVAGVILAGGQSRRMGGGDKCLLEFGGRPMLQWVIDRASSQVDDLVLNANGPPERFAKFGLSVVADVVPGHVGPLGGILTGMEWARRAHPECPWLVSFPADAPLVPADYVARLVAAVEGEGAELACAASGGRTHPVCGLWSIELAAALRRALVEEGVRKIDAWTAGRRLVRVDFGDGDVDPFFNINTPADLAEANRRVG